MTTWIHDVPSLQGTHVELQPLTEAHFTALCAAAADPRIWQFVQYDGSSPERTEMVLRSSLAEKEKGNRFPFTVFHKSTQQAIGSTSLIDYQPKHRKVEIGATWLRPDHWSTAVNIEAKLLLLTYCFEQLQAVRVQLKTDENNMRSRKAIQKIGARFEGILRNDLIRENNTKRNSAYFSILDDEWPGVREMLEARLAERSRY